jgi:hypothetical protein
MLRSEGIAWRTSQPRLHAFIGKISTRSATTNDRVLVLDQIGATIRQWRDTKDGDTEWSRRRSEYFEKTCLGRPDLRNQKQQHPDLCWQEFQRTVFVPEAVILSDPLREFFRSFDRMVTRRTGHLIGGGQLTFQPSELRPARLCPAGEIIINAWGPPEFLSCNDPTPQFPLPPKNIGRDYRPHEVYFAFAILHDADGGFEPFVTDDHPFRAEIPWWMTLELTRREASDAWVASLEPLFERLLTTFGSGRSVTNALEAAEDMAEASESSLPQLEVGSTRQGPPSSADAEIKTPIVNGKPERQVAEAPAGVPAEFRTQAMSKKKAATYLRQGNSDSAVEWLTQCIVDGTISCESLSRQSHVFDVRQFPAAVQGQIRPQ